MARYHVELIRRRLQEKLAELQICIHDLRTEEGGPATNHEPVNLEEEATVLEETSLRYPVLAIELKLLAEVRAALQRLDEGTYGLCTVCGQPIPEKRLEALPWVALCIRDQQQMEMHHAPSFMLKHT